MMSSSLRFAACAALIAFSAISGCKCGNQIQGGGCSSDQQCVDQNGGIDRSFCDTSKSPPACALHPKQCDTAADCCPGQICNASGHYCVDKYTPCTDAGSCPAPGQSCQTIGVFSSGLGCTYQKCGANNACPSGTACFNGSCVGGVPCDPGCSTGKVCITATNLCSPAPQNSTCQQTCPQGQVLVLKDPTNIFDTCHPNTEACECDALPPIQVHDVSRHSSLTANGGYLYVSAYDGEYGDLVVHTFDSSNLSAPLKTEWLDGVPQNGHLGGDVNGPRHGITDPGPNVGQYTSIASNANGDLFVAYYDVDNGDLKFTARYGGPGAAWIPPVTIDGTANGTPSGDVGLYTSIAVNSQGIPSIAYFRRGSYDSAAQAETGPSTALVYAAATHAQPTTRDDWKIVGDLDTATRPAPPCNNACNGANQACIADPAAPNGERCATKAASANQCTHPNTTQQPGCTGAQLCVLGSDASQTPVCRDTRTADAMPELPQGTGLMPSLAFIGDKPVIAYYDSLHKVLKAVRGTGSGVTPAFGSPVEIDGDDAAPAPVRDTGRWPSLAVSANGQIAIAFADLSSQQLLIYLSNDLSPHAAHAAAGQPGLIHVVDDGRPASGEAWHPQSFPGVQVAAAFTATGKVALAYQDATPVDLLFTTFDPVANKPSARSALRTRGSAGFWPRMAIANGTAWISSATIKAATAVQPANQLFVDSTPAP